MERHSKDDKEKDKRQSEKEGSNASRKKSKSKRDKAAELEESLKAARHSDSSLSDESGLDLSKGGRWGWKGNRSTIDISRMSNDVTIEKRRSTTGFGTAPPSEYDYSILHSYKRFGKAELGEDEEKRVSVDGDVTDDEAGKTEKATGVWNWKRSEKDEIKDEKKEEEENNVDKGQEEAAENDLDEKDKGKHKRTGSEKTEEVEHETEKTISMPQQLPRKSAVPTHPSSINVKARTSGTSKHDKYIPGNYEVLTPDRAGLAKLAALDASKHKKPLLKTPSKGVKKQPSAKFQPHPSEHKITPAHKPQPVKVKPTSVKLAPEPPKPKPVFPEQPIVEPILPEEPPEPNPEPPKPKLVSEPDRELPKLKPKPDQEPPKPKPKPVSEPLKSKPISKPPKAEPVAEAKPARRPSTPLPMPSTTLSPRPSSETIGSEPSDTHSFSSISTLGDGPRRSRNRRPRRPRPSELSAIDFDIDDELSSNLSDESQVSTRSPRKSLNIDDGPQKHPDDELLYTLTAKEEIVFRKSISEMRWEEEESMSDATGFTTGGESSSDVESTAAALLWERIGAGKKFTIPIIAVNDRRISLSHLDPEEPDIDEGPPAEKEKYDNVFGNVSSAEIPETDKDPVQAIFDMLNEAENRKKESQEEEDKKNAARAKLWRRRLLVVVLLNFVMKFRRPYVTFCELLVPIIICGVVISGMIKNSAGILQTLETKVFDAEAGRGEFDPFEQIGSEAIFTAFCSNEEFCSKGSNRHYFIVYSPANNFTEDIMKRALTFIGFDTDSLKKPTLNQAQGKDSDKDDDAEDNVSQLIGVKNASEVERRCREHWKLVSQFDEERDSYGSDIFERELNKQREQSRLIRYPMGIVFSMEGNLIGEERRKKIESDKDIPKSLTFTIRTFYSEVANTVEGFPFREHVVKDRKVDQGQRHFQSTPYLHTGIIGMQIALDFAFAEKIVEKAESLDPYMQIGSTKTSRKYFFRDFLQKPALKQFEYPTYKGKSLRVRGWLALTMAIVFSYLVGDILVAQDVVHEQNSGSIELLKIHGMTTSMRWTSNMIIISVFRGITTLAMALIIHYQLAINAVAEFSSPLFLWLFLWMHACTVTCFNYFITSGCGVKKPELAGLIVTCVCFVTLLSPLHFFEEGSLSRFTNVALCFFFPQWNLANGIYYYLRYEMYEEGLDWYDFPVIVDTDKHLIIALPLSCNIFLYSTMFYLSLTIYMDHILPREFSPRETWLFFCKSFTRRPPSESQATRPIPRSQKPSVYELGPKEAAYGPRFRNVTVISASTKATVLDNMSLDIYEGEVTCVVGQIGSGKSDFLNVIAGVNVPSSGFVDVKGLKVHDYHDITNRYVSLCPQRRLLIATLSVEDHIRLCCMLHGASYTKAKTQATFLLKMFGLMTMRRHSFEGLTPNDTKKLMLAMALSKSPSVLLLDNPIDQLDSESRFQFWKLLQELKPQRSIVVTCTTLEEAQLYGDRIAILSKGKLVCYGSPLYLRLAYGIGNLMTLRMSEGTEPDIWTMQQMMQKELSGAKTYLLETKGVSLQADTLTFILPFGKFYGGLLEKLEDSMERFGITKILMSQPSLWAFFLKISLHAGIEQVLAKREIRMIRGTDLDEHEGFERAVEPPIPVQKETLNHGFTNIVGVLVLKKYWYYKQKYFFFLLAYIPQIILIMLVVSHARLFLISEPESLSKVINTRMYQNNLVVFRSADNENTRKGWEEAFKQVLKLDDENINVEIFDYEDNLDAFLSQGLAHTLTHYKKQTIIAFSKDKKSHLGYYSSNSIHSAPIASHLMMQAFLYVISPDREEPYGTELVTNPFIQYRGFPAGSTQSNSSTILGLFLSLILCLLSAPVLRMILTERSSKFKSLQRMTGVSAWVYWFSHGMADYGMYVIITLICWGLVIFLDNIGYQQFDGWEERLALFVIFSAWLCWTALPYTYLMACMLPYKVTGYGHYILYHFMFGIIPKVVTYQFFRLYVHNMYEWLRYILYVFPPYSITSACVHYFHVVGDERWCRNVDSHACQLYDNVTQLLQNGSIKELFDSTNNLVSDHTANFLINKISFNDSFRTCCKPYCEQAGTCHERGAFFNVLYNEEVVIPHLQHDIIALAVNGVVFWILLILYEHEILHSVWSFLSTKVCGNLERTVAQRDVKTSDEPEDVKQEHQKVDYMVEIEGDVDSEVYLVQDVTKFYAYTKGLDHIYFSVPINTVTGLLGLPKSGKSTILEILTCQLAPSSGYIYKDNDLLEGKTKNHLMKKVGYSPQKSSVLTYLTGAQMLTVMGRLRGLSKHECDQHVLEWIQIFELQDVANKQCSTYRKGQEQRLCCALALIGDTNMVIFDEPTASMDNFEQYIFWNAISRLPKTMNRTVLFASINADEVQYQSSKALLMESGSLVAVGQLTEIFKNNNQGMTLAIRYGVPAHKLYSEFQKKAKLDKLKDHVITYLSPCALLDEHENLLIYHLKDQNIKLSRVYAVMEGAKVKFTTLLEHFQVFEPSLDDIILQFHKARLKRQADKIAASEETSPTAGTATKDKATESQKLSV